MWYFLWYYFFHCVLYNYTPHIIITSPRLHILVFCVFFFVNLVFYACVPGIINNLSVYFLSLIFVCFFFVLSLYLHLKFSLYSFVIVILSSVICFSRVQIVTVTKQLWRMIWIKSVFGAPSFIWGARGWGKVDISALGLFGTKSHFEQLPFEAFLEKKNVFLVASSPKWNVICSFNNM